MGKDNKQGHPGPEEEKGAAKNIARSAVSTALFVSVKLTMTVTARCRVFINMRPTVRPLVDGIIFLCVLRDFTI